MLNLHVTAQVARGLGILMPRKQLLLAWPTHSTGSTPAVPGWGG